MTIAAAYLTVPKRFKKRLSGSRGLSPLEESRLRSRLRTSTPSEPWVDAQILSRHHSDETGREIANRYFDPTIFPPGGRRTPMRWCRQCGRYTPINSLQLIEQVHIGQAPITATLICDDCHIGDQATEHDELYEALPNLRPAGSFSFFRMADLLGTRKSAR